MKLYGKHNCSRFFNRFTAMFTGRLEKIFYRFVADMAPALTSPGN